MGRARSLVKRKMRNRKVVGWCGNPKTTLECNCLIVPSLYFAHDIERANASKNWNGRALQMLFKEEERKTSI